MGIEDDQFFKRVTKDEEIDNLNISVLEYFDCIIKTKPATLHTNAWNDYIKSIEKVYDKKTSS